MTHRHEAAALGLNAPHVGEYLVFVEATVWAGVRVWERTGHVEPRLAAVSGEAMAPPPNTFNTTRPRPPIREPLL